MLITHDLGVVAEMAQRVIVMYAGRKVEEHRSTTCSRGRAIRTRADCSTHSEARRRERASEARRGRARGNRGNRAGAVRDYRRLRVRTAMRVRDTHAG
jgi:ABC-type dipeptide/oligopeptide/nickel transport system ATPase component